MLIGLCSTRPQVGKTEVLNYLEREKGFITGETSEAVSILGEKFFGYNGDKHDPKQRLILQEIGFMGRKINPTIWLYQALNLIRRKKIWGHDLGVSPSFLFYFNVINIMEEIDKNGLEKFLQGKNAVIGGIRNPDEADEIIRLGGNVVLIDRGSSEKNSHAVESELLEYNNFSDVIKNNGTFEDLYRDINSFLARLTEKF